MNRAGRLSRLAVAAVLGAGIVWAAMNRDRLDPAALDDWIGAAGAWAPIAYVAAYALATVAFVPGAVFGLAGGVLFGPAWGSLWNLAGATLGATLAFLVARYLAGDWIARTAGGRLQRLMAGVDAEGWRFVALVRLVPLFPFNLSNYALGLTRIPLLHYVVASFVFMAPGTIAYTWLGHAGRAALAGDAATIRYGLLGLALLAAIAFVPRLWRRFRAGSSWTEPGDLKRRLDAHENLTVIDVRGPDEFIGPLGHIAGARNIPVESLPNRVGELEGREREPVVLVCRTDKRSAKAAEVMLEAGFSNVAVLRGGMARWNVEGLPIERQAGAEQLE
jgi:uncharacterized membrane protein YdjX (TVP38/TMEM64 family)/rhodanese-related sulfurtransferase